jgi:hypothetical protein
MDEKHAEALQRIVLQQHVTNVFEAGGVRFRKRLKLGASHVGNRTPLHGLDIYGGHGFSFLMAANDLPRTPKTYSGMHRVKRRAIHLLRFVKIRSRETGKTDAENGGKEAVSAMCPVPKTNLFGTAMAGKKNHGISADSG